jgi:glycosyltransferase involved in cell wall biosynthesis
VRIAFLSWRELAHQQAGGSELVVDRLASGLVRAGHEVVLLCGGPTAPREYAVVDTGGKYSQYLHAPLKLRRLGNWDVVVDVENGIPFFAPFWQRRPVVCLMLHVHTEQWGLFFNPAVARLGRFLERRVMPAIYRRSLFAAISPSTASTLAELGIDQNGIRIVELGCDFVSAPAPKDRQPCFLALGRLVPHKRVDLLLDLWERVHPKVGGTLVVAGDGPDFARLRRRGTSSVRFLGHVSEREKHRLLGQAWLMVHTAMHEGWGTVVMEAAAAGTPTLAFDVRGVRDSVVEGNTGVLARNDEEFVDAWVRLTKDEAERSRLGAGARARAARFTWDRTLDRFMTVIDEAVERHRRSRS